MQKHTLKPKHAGAKARQIGRGGGRGKTSGRGHKGQKARAGGGPRPNIRDFIKTLPKLRGHAAYKKQGGDVTAVNLSSLEEHFSSGDAVSPESIVEKGIVRAKKGKGVKIKILGSGTLSKSVTVSGCALSESARKAVEKAGGSVQ